MAVYDIDRILVPAAPPEYEDHTRDVHYVPAPCQVACPIGTDAPSYIAHIWDEDYEAAFEAITATNPFSSICGRVCDAPCEPACRSGGSAKRRARGALGPATFVICDLPVVAFLWTCAVAVSIAMWDDVLTC